MQLSPSIRSFLSIRLAHCLHTACKLLLCGLVQAVQNRHKSVQLSVRNLLAGYRVHTGIAGRRMSFTVGMLPNRSHAAVYVRQNMVRPRWLDVGPPQTAYAWSTGLVVSKPAIQVRKSLVWRSPRRCLQAQAETEQERRNPLEKSPCRRNQRER